MGGASVEVEGAGKVEDAFTLLVRKADAATRNAVGDVVTIIHRDIANNLRKKSHPKGTPTPSAPGEPPALITGSLMRSIKDQPIRRLGQGVYLGGTGPTIVYARIQELSGRAGRHHRSFLPARPYVRPAVKTSHARVQARFAQLLREVSRLG